jgi:hypothetical protein
MDTSYVRAAHEPPLQGLSFITAAHCRGGSRTARKLCVQFSLGRLTSRPYGLSLITAAHCRGGSRTAQKLCVQISLGRLTSRPYELLLMIRAHCRIRVSRGYSPSQTYPGTGCAVFFRWFAPIPDRIGSYIRPCDVIHTLGVAHLSAVAPTRGCLSATLGRGRSRGIYGRSICSAS